MAAKGLILNSSFYEALEGENRLEKMKSIFIALAILELIEYQNLENDDYWDWRAGGFELLRKNEQAIIYYSKAIEINSKNVYYYEKRAKCKMAIENHYGAIPDFTKALALTPNNDSLLGKRAICYIVTQQWNNAMLDINKAISINNKIGLHFLTRGLIHMNFNRKKEACLDFSTGGDLGEEKAFKLLHDFCRDN